MDFATGFSSFIHGYLAGTFAGIGIKTGSALFGILFLLSMVGAIYWGATQGWVILIPNSIAFSIAIIPALKT